MSWFDPSGIASLAKTALKEAQKTIDKALDIQDDELPDSKKVTITPTAPANTPVVTTEPDFFGNWGLNEQETIVTKSPVKHLNNSSLWGSFTGSFFDQAKEDEFKNSKLVVRDDEPRLSIISNDSVEVLESPDSIEVISSGDSISKLSPESIEIISEDDEVSESTLTILEKEEPPITKPPGKMFVPIDTQPQSGLNIPTLVESPNVINPDEGELSDRTLESSTETVTTSSYVTNLLADAMIEKKREQSPQSLSSEIIKLETTSDHTSGDELETQTSSDIEIISSPNGDSSSTQSISRQSPAKLYILPKPVDDVEKLLKRISEITEILESRETKLIEINRENIELTASNAALKQQVDLKLESTDQVAEEYTQRMSALERKFQSAIREKDLLRKQLDTLAQEAEYKSTRNDFEVLLKEKEGTIKELREEGEKLSKVQLQHSNIIKKLRATEKDQGLEIKRLKEQIEELQSENDRIKKSLTAKEKLERSQIESIHQLTSKSNKLEKENSSLKSQLDDANQRLETTKTSLDAAKKELNDKHNTSYELQAREKALAEMETSKKQTQSQNEEIINQLEDLREKLTDTELQFSRKERDLRNENMELLKRLENSEARNEELAESVSMATKPLIRQLDTLQSTFNYKQTSWEKQESELVEKLHESQKLLINLTENEQKSKQECTTLKSRLSTLESNYNNSLLENGHLSTKLEETIARLTLAEMETNRVKEKYEDALNKSNQEMEILQNEILNIKSEIDSYKIEIEHLKTEQESSPTVSLGRVSLSESLGSLIWPQDDLDSASASGRNTVYDSVRGNPTAVLEHLQSTIKLRDGEIQQLQWEMARRDNERTLLTNELALLTSKLDGLEEVNKDFEVVKDQFNEIHQKYDAMCQMYGEKVEEVQELRLDLEDVKDMYKSQIDELLKKQKGGL